MHCENVFDPCTGAAMAHNSAKEYVAWLVQLAVQTESVLVGFERRANVSYFDPCAVKTQRK